MNLIIAFVKLGAISLSNYFFVLECTFLYRISCPALIIECFLDRKILKRIARERIKERGEKKSDSREKICTARYIID